jgi:PAS domain S-box-containing protein
MSQLKSTTYEMVPFFERTLDLVCVASKEGFFKKVNQSVIDKLEYSEDELSSRPIHSFIHPLDKEMTRLERAKLLDGKPLVNFQNRYIAKSGKIVWLDWTSIYFAEEEVVFAIAKDVTERKLAEKQVEEKYKKYKSLARHFKTSIEKDRKYLATELHEELAQLAAVVKMDIDWITANTSDLPANTKTRLDHASLISGLMINAIRRMSFSISPNMLEDLGLNETLKWLCEEFAILNGIPCRFETSCDDEMLTDEIRLDFFRICQESLSNVMYHAAAHAVTIKLEVNSRKICLSIIDDGKGFDSRLSFEGSGLTSMRERVASINGRFQIKTDIGMGTTVSVTLLL